MQRLDPNAVKLLLLYPTPTSGGLFNNFFYTPKSPSNTNQFDVRIDNSFGQRDQVFGVYSWSKNTGQVPGFLPGIANGQNYNQGLNVNPGYAFAAGYTDTFSPTLTNEAHFGYNNTGLTQIINDYANKLGIPAAYGIMGIPQTPNNGGLPVINVGSFTGLGSSNYTPTIRNIVSLEIHDDVTKTYLGHTFKVGVQMDRLSSMISQPAYGKGGFTFSGAYTSVVNQTVGTNGIADLLVNPT